MVLVRLAAILIVVLLAACATGDDAMESFTKERIELTASDGQRLIASYYDAPGDGIILLHQLGRSRESWNGFAKELQRLGYAVLAIDLRGHGESAGKWQSFSEKDFIAMLKDVEAGETFIQKKEKRVAVVMGASIGANTALRFSSEQNVPAVLLSPGLEYKGIEINGVTSRAATLIVVAEDDAYSFSSSKELEENNLFGEHRLVTIGGSAHGTDMLPEAKEAILAFLAEI